MTLYGFSSVRTAKTVPTILNATTRKYSGLVKDSSFLTEMTDLFATQQTSGSVPLSPCSIRLERVIIPEGDCCTGFGVSIGVWEVGDSEDCLLVDVAVGSFSLVVVLLCVGSGT